ncbi:MAG: hypothetical protein K1X50_07130 [Candidatus Promineofilum sp.]|nr:hypothetical protein [Promineifilum sp.]MCW5863840.1 hypothetical protein [Anaerolineae bacterium]
MRLSAIIQMLEEDPILGELDGRPDAAAHFLTVHNPRRRDGRAVPLFEANVETVLIAWHRIATVQLLPQAEVEKAIGFVRE